MREIRREESEYPRSVEEWVAQIEFRWKVIPEFEVNPEKLKHLAIICDGNRRAAREQRFHDWDGHRAGVEIIKGISRAAREWEIHTLTFWVWSTENWRREPEQVKFIMELAAKGLNDERVIEELIKNQVRFTHLGRKNRLLFGVAQALENLEAQTVNFNRYRLNLVMDYGGLDETARGIGKMFESFQEGKFDPKILQENPQTILEFLDTAEQPQPDLVIRTGVKEGEIPHTSGFMPLQTAYAGWAFLPDLFPDLTPQTLLESIQKFEKYERRHGR